MESRNFLQQQSEGEFLVDNGSLYPALQREWDFRTVEDFAQRAPRQVLQPHARRAEGTSQGNIEVATIRGSHGEDSGTGGMRNAAMVVKN